MLMHQRKDFIEGNARYVVQFIMLHNVVLTSEFINKIQKVLKFLSEKLWGGGAGLKTTEHSNNAVKQRCALSTYLSFLDFAIINFKRQISLPKILKNRRYYV